MASPRVMSVLRTRISSVRAYSTTPGPTAKDSSNLANILLGAGLLGAGAFWFSTRGSAKETAERKLAALVPKTPALSNDEFRNLKLVKVTPYNHNTSTFSFELPPGTEGISAVASALVVKSATEGLALAKNGKPAIRPYTPTTVPGAEGQLDLLVKVYPTGVMSKHIHDLKVGDSLAFKGPIPKFPYVANQFESISLIAGGSGITPMYQIMQQIDSNPADKTKATLIFGNVTEQDVLLRKEFQDMAARKPNQFKVVFVLDKPTVGWQGESGFIGTEILKKYLPAPLVGEKMKIFICGPPAQVESISGNKISNKDQGELKGALKELGYAPEQVYKF